jgi:N-acetyl sugar amidotransferase
MLQNVEHVVKQLGLDRLVFKPNWDVSKKLMYESLKRKGDFCWHCHTGIFAYPMQVAAKLKVPLLFWGEKSSEYMAYYSYEDKEEVDERRFNRYSNLGITAEDMAGMIEGITLKDLQPYTYPKLKDLQAINYRSVCLGSYIKWDTRKNVDLIKKELGWKTDCVEGVPDIYDYDKVECSVVGVRDWLKYIKRGFGRTAHLASVDIRNGRMAREQAMRYLKQFDGKRPASLDYFMEILGINEEEFMDLALQHVVSPWEFSKEKLEKTEKGKPLWDQKLWDRTR